MSIGTTSNMEWLVGNGGGGGSVEYTAGHGIDIDNVDHIISVDQSEIQDKLTAGDNITITNNVISAADQVQSDWTEADTSSPAYIAHKPTIPTATSDLTNDSNFITASDVPSSQVQSDWTESDSSDPAYIANKPNLATVATSGDYSDLSNTPTIPSGNQLLPGATSSDEGKILTVDSNGDPEWAPAQTYSQVQSNWNETDSSAVSYIQNKPSIPTATSDLTNDSNFITASDVPGAQVQSDWTESDTSSAAYIAHKPSIPTATSDLTNDSNFITASDVPGAQVQSDWTESDTSSAAYIAHKPSIPTATSDLTNDSNFITASDVPGAQVQSDWTESDTSSAAYIAHKPSIPTATSDLTNDSNFITASDVPSAQVQSDWNESNSSSAAYIANKPTIPTVDQSYSSSSTNAQSGTAVAQAISGLDEVPTVTSSDDGKVLVATYSGGTGSYAWASAPPANAIILDSNSTWSDFHTPYAAGRKDIYYKHTSPYSPFDSRAELYLHLTAVSDVDGTSSNFTFALFEAAWQSGGVDYSVQCKFRYSGNPLVHTVTLAVDQSYSSTSTRAQSGVAVAQAISAVNQVPASTSADEAKVLTVDANGDTFWNTPAQFTQQQSDWTQMNTQSVDYIKNKPGAKPVLAGPGIQITETSNDITISTTTLSGISEIKFVQSLPASPVAGVLYLIPQT